MDVRRTTLACSRIALVVALCVISFLAFTDRQMPAVERLNDKAMHALAFAALALLSDLSFPAKRFGPAIVVSLLGYGLFIEVVQYFLPYRSASVLDWIADGLGIAGYALSTPALKKVPVLRRHWEPSSRDGY